METLEMAVSPAAKEILPMSILIFQFLVLEIIIKHERNT